MFDRVMLALILNLPLWMMLAVVAVVSGLALRGIVRSTGFKRLSTTPRRAVISLLALTVLALPVGFTMCIAGSM